MKYKEISEQLGVSVDWCKRNLKSVKKDSDIITEACVNELVSKATKPEGLTVYEANAIIFKHHKEKQLSKDQIRNIRDKAIDKNSDCIFRPPWVDATAPTKSYKSMLAYTSHMVDEMDNVVRWYCESHPTVNPHSVRYEILKHLFPKISGEPLTGRMMRNEVMVELLENRSITKVTKEDELCMDTDKTTTQTDLHLTDKDLIGEVSIESDVLDSIWKVHH
jgi:DNA-binding Lrp family transcriptional regulator